MYEEECYKLLPLFNKKKGDSKVKKIVAFVGSNNKASRTVAFTKKIVAKIQENYNGEINLELYTLQNVDIEMCMGCSHCFIKGSCPLKDDVNQLFNKMKEADLIILGSPVYMHGVSGGTKNFIDRISWQAHLLSLAGKGAVAVSTCMSNGHLTAVSQLEKYLTDFGATVIEKTNSAIEYPDEFLNQEWMEKKCQDIANKIINFWNSEDIKTSELVELKFKAYKKIMEYRYNAGDYSFEPMHWKNSRMLEFNSLYEYLNYK